MERVAFLVESTGTRISCLLNPESIVVRRTAGVKTRRSAGGLLTGGPLADDPLLYVGGGTTEIDLDLLFDVTVAAAATTDPSPATAPAAVGDPDPIGENLIPMDVRTLTRPLQELTEKKPADPAGSPSAPPVVRLIWGKGWNVPGVIVSMAERFDFFTSDGLPQRSWLRMRLRRVSETAAAPEAEKSLPDLPATDAEPPVVDPQSLTTHDLPGAGLSPDADPADPPPAAERIDEIAFQHFGISDAWRFLASFNNVDDPGSLPAGASLLIPPKSAWSGA